MVLQAFIDDSGNEPNQKHFVLAGFLSTAERWAAFSDEWRAVLDRPNPTALGFYKHTQAKSLKGEFSNRKGWTDAERNKRELALAEVAARHAIYRFDVSVSHEDWAKYVRSVPLPQRRRLIADHPYVLLAGQALSAVAVISNMEGLHREKVDFYFDSQEGFEPALREIWTDWRRSCATAPIPVKIGDLMFKDDTEFLPLQAADMFAGSLRFAHMTNEATSALVTLWRGIKGQSGPMKPQQLERLGTDMLAMAQGVSKRYCVPLVHFGPDAARQRKKFRRLARATAKRKR